MTDFPTQQEIVDRFNARKDGDMFGFEVSEYVPFLDFEHARPFLKAVVTAEEWEKCRKPATRGAVVAVMLDYMPFAWEKANDQRGLSAGRSIAHYVAWLWLAGERDLAWEIEEYTDYGRPQLRKICARFGWDAERFQ